MIVIFSKYPVEKARLGVGNREGKIDFSPERYIRCFLIIRAKGFFYQLVYSNIKHNS